MRRLLVLPATMPVLLCALLCAGGCHSEQIYARERGVNFHIVPSSTDVLAGETVTITTSSQNTAGRHPAVRWSSTGGRIKIEDFGSIARLTFDRAGDYAVTALLTVEGKTVAQDAVNIHVKPAP